MSEVAAGTLRTGEPLGVYVHFPFCGVRCPYCDFAVDTRTGIPHDGYADAVVAEIAARRGWYDGAGSAYVFQRFAYCPGKCQDAANKNLPECVNCSNGAAGEF